jgi:hypothetical protein
MTHAHLADHAHAPTAAGAKPYFPEAEWNHFESEDKTAARMIVGLMSGIFTIGFFLYLTIAIVVGT